VWVTVATTCTANLSHAGRIGLSKKWSTQARRMHEDNSMEAAKLASTRLSIRRNFYFGCNVLFWVARPQGKVNARYSSYRRYPSAIASRKKSLKIVFTRLPNSGSASNCLPNCALNSTKSGRALTTAITSAACACAASRLWRASAGPRILW